jgi:Tfp pilus tip-associated adhesin PilY1
MDFSRSFIMQSGRFLKPKSWMALAAFWSLPLCAATDLTTSPLSGAAAAPISPNVMFIMDDSQSMEWDYLPDWAGGKNNIDPAYRMEVDLWQSANSKFNGVAYNPEITYEIPVYYTSGGALTTDVYKTQNSANTNAWLEVRNNPYLPSDTSTSELVGNAYYFRTIPGEYCSNISLRNCVKQGAPSADYPHPAYLRWCNSETSAGADLPTLPANACQATEINNRGTSNIFGYPRMPSPYMSRVSLTAGGAVNSIKVNGLEILSAPVSAASSVELSYNTADAINECSFKQTGACATIGYLAMGSENGYLYIYAPSSTGNSGISPVIDYSGGAIVPTAFAHPANNKAAGDIEMIVIHSGRTAYPKASSRQDCAGSVCTYPEEMTNYANWWAYYRTRMLTMKTAISRAFAPIETDYRVGFISINNKNATSQMGDFFMNVETFTPANKLAWYDKMFSTQTVVDYTPLRLALAHVGKIYAGKLAGTYNGHEVKDPVQYSCQQNVTILSTDGFWNSDAGATIEGNPVGDQDGKDVLPKVERPQLDGGTPGWVKVMMRFKEKKTPTVATWWQSKQDKTFAKRHKLETRTRSQAMSRTSRLKKTTSTLQSRKAPLQAETSQLQTRVGQVWKNIKGKHVHWEQDQITQRISAVQTRSPTTKQKAHRQKLQQRTQTLRRTPFTLRMREFQLLRDNITQAQKQTSKLQKKIVTQAQKKQGWGGQWTDVDECDPVNTNIQCRWKPGHVAVWVDSGTCTKTSWASSEWVGMTTDNPRVVIRTTVDCAYGSWLPAAWENVDSCTPVDQSPGPNYTVGTAVKCKNTTSGTEEVHAPDTCTQGPNVQCKYATTPVLTYPSTCTYTPGSSGTAHGTVWSVNKQVICDYLTGVVQNNVTECTPVAKSTGTAAGTVWSVQNAVECNWSGLSGYTYPSSCTPQSNTADGTGKLTGPAVQCSWAPSYTEEVDSCSVTPSDQIDAFQLPIATVQCESVSGYTDWTYAQVTPEACVLMGANLCKVISNGTWTNVSACTPGFDGTYYTQCGTTWKQKDDTCPPGSLGSDECRLDWHGWQRVDQCTKVAEDMSDLGNPVYQVDCKIDGYQYAANSGWQSASSCTAAPAQNGPGFYKGSVECGYAPWSPPATVSACSPVAQSTGPGYTVGTATRCSYSPYWWSLDGLQSGVWTPVSTCVVVDPPAGDYSAPAKIQCRYDPVEEYVTDGVCTPSGAKDNNTQTVVECAYELGSWVPVTLCTPTDTGNPLAAPPSAPNGTGLPNEWVQCDVSWQDWHVATGPCTVTAGDEPTECRYNPTGSWFAGACTVTPDGAPGTTPPTYTVLEKISACTTSPLQDWAPPLGGTPLASCEESTDPVTGVTTYCQKILKPPTEGYAVSCVPTNDDGTPEHSRVECFEEFQGAGVVDPNCKAQETDLSDPTAPGYPQAPDYWQVSCQEILGTPTPDTLADVAQYYYMTDLRTPAYDNCLGAPVDGVQHSVCENIVPPSGASTIKSQHMTTYTLGLGASGLMQYQPDYLDAESGDYFSIKTGQTVNQAEGICTWQQEGSCNWPKPESGSQTNIDDTWHAAVNGRGVYYSAGDPSSLATGLSDALAKIIAREGSLAAVTLANPNLVVGENALYSVDFQAGAWTGNLHKLSIDGQTGVITYTPTKWSAQAKLDAKVDNEGHANRKIYAFKSDASNKLRDFKWANLTATEKGYFQGTLSLSQFCTTGTICLTPGALAAAKGEPLFDFIRGDRSNEGPIADKSKYFRERAHLLGDIVGSQAAFVGMPPWDYVDHNYLTFKNDKVNRKPMLYVGANDGMLHAFDEATGQEAWAYVPSMVMPELYRLADKAYADKHHYFVDGTPVMGDICASGCAAPATSTVWKTILVGGLNNGGKGYYALDITDPENPKGLWEFTNTKLGMTYGNPVITKLANGTWVVIVTSGYNNTDGEGHLFILDAQTGNLIRTISTGEGTPSNPSGLAKISAWATYPMLNNMALRVYGGDLLGNLWRFDINGNIPTTETSYDARLLATLRDAEGNPQPITTRPELGKAKTNSIVFVATGQLLGATDLSNNARQSIYAIRDKLTGGDADSYGDPRESDQVFVQQTMVKGTCPADNSMCTEGEPVVKIESTSPVDFNYNAGWYVDFPDPGERVNVDMLLLRGVLYVVSNTPKNEACVSVGTSRTYFLNYLTGGALPGTDGVAGKDNGSQFGNAPAGIVDSDGNAKIIVSGDCSNCMTQEKGPQGTGLTTRRISWSEVLAE